MTPIEEPDDDEIAESEGSEIPEEIGAIREPVEKLTPEQEEITRKTSRAIIEYILTHTIKEKSKLTPIKCAIGKANHYKNTIKDSTIIRYVKPEEMDAVMPYLRRRATRTISGVTMAAIMTKPYECPGKCIYCPGPTSQPGQKAAQSYTGKEPAAMRSIMYKYDPYQQTLHRLDDQLAIGHNVDKIEVIVMGGTVLHTPIEYQNEFVKGCFDAIINFREPNYNNDKRTPDLETAKKVLETASTKLTGVTFETRPDYCKQSHVDRMLDMGGTRVELGIQTTREEVLQFICRGHGIKESVEALRIAKDAGIKITAHMMPNLPLSTPDSDIAMFQELFANPDFRPDNLKIYPTLVVNGTKLYEMYQKGEYKPYPQTEIVKVIAAIKAEIPPYVRIQRIQRDIPAYLIIDGVKNSNLREMVQKELKTQKKKCHCIRCREEGFQTHTFIQDKEAFNFDNVKLYNIEYFASKGTEVFISFEDKEKEILIGYCRLRFPSPEAHRPEIKGQNAAIIRELKVVGELVRPSATPKANQMQHRGYGKALILEAERIAKEKGYTKLLVISGIGVRAYFYKLGFQPDGPYVSKSLI